MASQIYTLVLVMTLVVASAASMSPHYTPRGARNADHYQPKPKSLHELKRQLKHTLHDRLIKDIEKAPKYEHEKYEGMFCRCAFARVLVPGTDFPFLRKLAVAT